MRLHRLPGYRHMHYSAGQISEVRYMHRASFALSESLVLIYKSTKSERKAKFFSCKKTSCVYLIVELVVFQ